MVRSARNNKGFSLIELMIAVVFIMISMMALATSVTVSMQTSLDNAFRDTAIRVANETAEALFSLTVFPSVDPELYEGLHTRIQDNITQSSKGIPNTVQTVRGRQIPFDITWNVVMTTSNVRQILITVKYVHRNQTHTNESVIYKK